MYEFNWYNVGDGTHPINTGYLGWGEKLFGIAYYQWYFEGGVRALRPSSISQSAFTIDILMKVPDGQLAFDTVTVTEPVVGLKGFELDAGSGGTAVISAVSILADYNGGTKTQTLRIIYTGTLGTGAKVAYARTGTLGAFGGPTTGPRGCLKSPNTIYTSLAGNNLDNWCVTFEESL